MEKYERAVTEFESPDFAQLLADVQREDLAPGGGDRGDHGGDDHGACGVGPADGRRAAGISRTGVSLVVIGGGIAGVQLRLPPREGRRRAMSSLVEKGELTSGSTHHAAGLVTQFNPSQTMMRFRRYSVELYRELGVFETVGSLRIASSPRELARAAARGEPRQRHRARRRARRARGGAPAACRRRAPDSLYGAVWMPGDGYVDPHIATHAVADAAARARRRDPHPDARDRDRARPARRGPGGRDRRTAASRPSTVVNAAGMWAPRVAAMVGAFACSIPVDHQHIALRAVDGHELPREHAVLPRHRQPRLREGREPAACSSAATSRTRSRAGRTACRGSTASEPLPPDHARFQQLMAGAVAALSVARRRRRDRARLPSRRDDARRQSAARAGAGCARVLAGRRPVAERVRRRRRAGQGARRAGDDRRDARSTSSRTGRGASAARTATRPSPPRARARSTSTTTASATRYDVSEAGRPKRAVPAARAPAGARRRVRDEERLGARRLLQARASSGGGPARSSARSAGHGRRSTIASRSSTRRSASGWGSST